MRERPILFSAPMVRALLDGKKTQTRRVVKLPSASILEEWKAGTSCTPNGPLQTALGHKQMGTLLCPHGQPGDRLWVREAWKAHTTFDHLPPRDIPQSHVWYMADSGYKAESRFRQGMFMPRWSSRIDLEVTGVRVERLQDITEQDAMEEGFYQAARESPNGIGQDVVGWYRELWDSLNAASRPVLPSNPNSARYARVKAWLEKHPDTTSWAANPWIWVIEFRRLKP